MKAESPYCLLESATLVWPSGLQIPSKRFRLFVAADVTGCTTEAISEFAVGALKNGMLYFCAWCPDCERFHDIVDEQIVMDDIGEKLFAGPGKDDTIMTTWHNSESLQEALDFFKSLAFPTEGFANDSEYWFAVCLNNPGWAASIRQELQSFTSDRQRG
jgi:hypothetical protein